MKPTKFKEQNCTFAENQPEYLPLPAHKVDSPQGEVISCWKLSFRERIKILFTGEMWVCLMMFGKPLTPSFFTVNKSDLYYPCNEKRIVKKGVKLYKKLLKINIP